jgi:pimeloyl-ACP methyl ester carboxylesterase
MVPRKSRWRGFFRNGAIVVAIVAAVLGGCAAVTQVWVGRIERAHPPDGRFVAVDGGRMHVVELGPADGPPLVLVHGASGNLGDIRLALGVRLSATYRVILVDRPGHGWSDRPDGLADADPARQATLIHDTLAKLGVARPIMVAHSWGGAVGAAYALAYPQGLAGLVLLAPAVYPWPGGVAWYNSLVKPPLLGPLFVHTLALPLGELLIDAGVKAVFEPQQPPPDYLARAGGELVLRPDEFTANAEDIGRLKGNLARQSPHYPDIQTPTVIVTGDSDEIVSPQIHSVRLASVLPHGKLVVLPGVGHMVHYAAPDRIVTEVNELAARIAAAPQAAAPVTSPSQ